jgi:hypothetical protein
MILDLFMELISGLYRMIIEAVFSPFREALNLFTSTPEKLAEFQFINIIFGKFRVVGFALWILIIGWQVFKIFFSYLGFECEDPLKVAGRAIIFGFLIYYSKDLIYVILEIFKNAVNLVWQAWGMGDAADGFAALINAITGFIFNTTGVLTFVQMILVLYMIYKFIRLAFRFAERLILCALLIMTSPLAFAAGTSSATGGFLSGWIKLFAGNLVMQLVQIAMFISIVTYMGTRGGITDIYGFVIIIAMIKILDKLEDIMRDVSVHVGVSRDMGSAMRSLITAAHSTRFVVSTIRNISG